MKNKSELVEIKTLDNGYKIAICRNLNPLDPFKVKGQIVDLYTNIDESVYYHPNKVSTLIEHALFAGVDLEIYLNRTFSDWTPIYSVQGVCYNEILLSIDENDFKNQMTKSLFGIIGVRNEIDSRDFDPSLFESYVSNLSAYINNNVIYGMVENLQHQVIYKTCGFYGLHMKDEIYSICKRVINNRLVKEKEDKND